MKTAVHYIILFTIFFTKTASAQITTPVVNAGFGVDADLRNHYVFNTFQYGNDDWFYFPGSLPASDVAGIDRFIIDTTGAAALIASYGTSTADPDRMKPFFRGMRFPQYSLLNSRLLVDAVFVRDYHGTDTTAFTAGSDKNGQSPAGWTGGIQGIPDKNDILDMMMHVRRAGIRRTDPLWMIGGLSLDNTQGNRYFDFEMYQTDIYYDRATRKFYGYGPDMGHTSWRLDPTTGDILTAGDVTFSASYQSGGLSEVVAYIWVHKSALSIVPLDFNWVSTNPANLNGEVPSPEYGYAAITPKTAGDYYTGLQCANGTWGGPFNVILQDNTMVTDYQKWQFVEFSVNLTKLGLDPVTLLGGDICGMPFRRLLVKTRASESFTSELKDFIGPFDLFLPARAQLQTETPTICATGGLSTINIVDYVSSSTYVWTTPDGHIVTTYPDHIDVDMPGRYIVTQYLKTGCSEYARDTIDITALELCGVLDRNIADLRGSLRDRLAKLTWKMLDNDRVDYFEIERSTDGTSFSTIARVDRLENPQYVFENDLTEYNRSTVYYRIRIYEKGKGYTLSPVVRLSLYNDQKQQIVITPNPVKDIMQVEINALVSERVVINLYDQSGKLVKTMNSFVQRGNNVLTFTDMSTLAKGVYQAVINLNGERFSEKLLKAN